MELTIARPLLGEELVNRMKGWVTVDVERANQILASHGRLKLLDDHQLVVECEDRASLDRLAAELAQAFGDQMDLEITKG